MKPQILVLWHTPSNMLATCPIRKDGGLPLLCVLDDEFKGINPFFGYPLKYLLEYHGWEMLGEL